MKENEFKDLYEKEEEPKGDKTIFVSDCQVDTDLEILIPDDYVETISERLNLYRELDNSETEEDLLAFEARLIDRFGPVPMQTLELINALRLRRIAIKLGFEKITIKNKKFMGYFISKQDSMFYSSPGFASTLQFIQQNSKQCRLKEQGNKLYLIAENIKNISEGIDLLNRFNPSAFVGNN